MHDSSRGRPEKLSPVKQDSTVSPSPSSSYLRLRCPLSFRSLSHSGEYCASMPWCFSIGVHFIQLGNLQRLSLGVPSEGALALPFFFIWGIKPPSSLQEDRKKN